MMRVKIEAVTHALELDEGADHARAESALLAWSNVVGHG